MSVRAYERMCVCVRVTVCEKYKTHSVDRRPLFRPQDVTIKIP